MENYDLEKLWLRNYDGKNYNITYHDCSITNFDGKMIITHYDLIKEVLTKKLFYQFPHKSISACLSTNERVIPDNPYHILPTLCPKGTMRLSNLHPSPNTNIYIQLIHNSKNVHSPNPVPEGHTETLQLTPIPQVLACYIQYKDIYSTDT